MKLSFSHIAPFLNTGQNKASRWLSYIGLGIGVVLLLCSIQMYINISELLKSKNPRKDGYDYISVTKNITNENMARDHSFSPAEMDELKKQSAVEDAAPLLANNFIVKATGGSTLPFESDFFMEAIDERFIDTVPASFTWKEGQAIVPVIVSSDYVELYNAVFAPSRDLPQFSEKSISSIVIRLECRGNMGEENFGGNIVALTDRINSVLVPKNFLEWANRKFGSPLPANPTRIIIKTKDANNPDLLKYLQQKDYRINRDKTKFGRVKTVLQGIVSGLAGFGILVILLAMVLFSFYLQLMIARSRENLQLLLTIGYSPHWLSVTVAKKWIPVYVMVILLSLLVTALLHWGFQYSIMNNTELLSPFVHWMVLVIAAILLSIAVLVNFRLLKKQLYQL
ncbi:MAG: hypothetical protein U0X40_08750 [Ferruginibacter sp.]